MAFTFGEQAACRIRCSASRSTGSSACTASQRNLQCSNVGKRRPESREPGAANRLLLIAERVLKELESRKIPGIHAENCALHRDTESQSGVQNRVNGGESVSQSLLMYKLFFIPAHGHLRFSLPVIGFIRASPKPQASAQNGAGRSEKE